MKKQVNNECEKELGEEIKIYKKLEEIDFESESFEEKLYLRELKLSQGRVKFKLRSLMLEIKNNFKGEYRKTNLECEACEEAIETQAHLLICTH